VDSSTLAGRDRQPRLFGLTFVVGVLAVGTVAVVALLGKSALFALLPLILFVSLYALLKLPLRVPLFFMMFIGLTFENPGDVPATGLWKSPLYDVGKLFLSQLKHSLGSGALVMTGSDLVILLFFVIYLGRRVAGSTLDTRGAIPCPRPLISAAVICVLAALALWVFGLARGGSNRFALWQVHHVVYLPLMFLLMQSVVPDDKNYRPFARLILFAACLKSLLAIWLRGQFPDADYTTTHHDSMLFALAVCMLSAHWLEKPTFRSLVRCLPLLLLIVFGMIANDRRLVWAELGVAGLCMFALSRRSRFKVALVRTALLALPLIIGYVAVGWNSSGGGVFRPVGIVRSMVDSKVDQSSEWRDLENFNLVSTVKANPVLGTGFGHPMVEEIKLPSVVDEYELEPYLPHNSMLGLWAYCGYVGFTLIWMMLAITVYFAARAYRMATLPFDRAAAMSSFAMVVIYMAHLYGDMALGTWTSIYLVSFAMMVAGKTAVKVGAWRGFRRRAPQPVIEQVQPRRLW
jgi:hypothetical protein